MNIPRFAMMASAGLLLALGAGRAMADPPIVMDYNGDGVVNSQDGIDYATDKLYYNASTRPWADLNGDGIINGDDDTIFYGSVRPNTFGVYWGIGLSSSCYNGYPDNLDISTTALASNLNGFVQRSVAWIGEWSLYSVLPKYKPIGCDDEIGGIQLLLDDSFELDENGDLVAEPSITYTTRKDNFDAAIDNIVLASRSTALTYWDTAATYPMAYVDIEFISPSWINTKYTSEHVSPKCGAATAADSWRDCVEQINWTSFDSNFTSYITPYCPTYSPPLGVNGFSDSYWTTHQSEYNELAGKAYVAFCTRMFEAIKIGIQGNLGDGPSPFENVPAGYYGWPMAYFGSSVGKSAGYDWTASEVDDDVRPLLETADLSEVCT